MNFRKKQEDDEFYWQKYYAFNNEFINTHAIQPI